MTIVSSVIEQDGLQVDGRRSVVEVHIDHLGDRHMLIYLAEAATDLAARLPARAAWIEAQLAQRELERNVGEILARDASAQLTFQHSTVAAMRQRLRDVFRDASRLEALALAAFLRTLSDAQLKALFGLDDLQVVSFRLRLDERKALLDDVKAAVGE